MICSKCGNNVADAAAACPGCGAQLTTSQGPDVRVGAAAGAAAGSPAGHVAAAMGPAFNLDLKRLTRDDQIVGGATLVLFISLFLPWFSVSVKGFGSTFAGGSVNGLYHGYMYIDLILALAVLAFLVMRAGFDQLPFRLPVGPDQALLVATGINVVLALISFVFKPAGGFGVSVGWGIGAYLGLIAAIAAVAPLGVPFLRSRTGR
jgi:hypothetical protein